MVRDLNGLLTLDEAAVFAGYSTGTILRWAQQGRLEYARIGHQWVFEKEDVRAAALNTPAMGRRKKNNVQ